MISRRSLVQGTLGAGVTAQFRLKVAEAAVTAKPTPYPILGIDCKFYPGDSAMDALFADHGFRFACLYLGHHPFDRDTGWISKRQHLVDGGWGLVPTYLVSDDENAKESDGTEHGKDVVRAMTEAGFPQGAVVYLDIEHPKLAGGAYEKYAVSLMKAVRDGKFYPGIYGSYKMLPWTRLLTNAIWTVELPNGYADVLALTQNYDLQDAPADDNKLTQTLFDLGVLSYNPKIDPHGIIHEGAIATQYAWKKTFKVKLDTGIKNEFDLSWSLVRDPSDPQQLAAYFGVPQLK